MSPIALHDIQITISPSCCNNGSCPNCCTGRSPDTPDRPPLEWKVEGVALEAFRDGRKEGNVTNSPLPYSPSIPVTPDSRRAIEPVQYPLSRTENRPKRKESNSCCVIM